MQIIMIIKNLKKIHTNVVCSCFAVFKTFVKRKDILIKYIVKTQTA